MSASNIPSYGAYSAPSIASASSASAKNAATSAANYSDPAVKEFMDFMNETPAQRMEDMWLASHHLTRDDLKHMSPEKRAAILKEMAEDIKRHVIEKAEEAKKKSANSGSI